LIIGRIGLGPADPADRHFCRSSVIPARRPKHFVAPRHGPTFRRSGNRGFVRAVT
jgi:hypothetical protein